MLTVSFSPPAGGLPELPNAPATRDLLVNATYRDNGSRRYKLTLRPRVPEAIIELSTHGARIRREPRPGRPPGARRGKVGSMSKASRIRAAWTLANAPVEWRAMITLTFPAATPDYKKHFNRWKRRMRWFLDRPGGWAWLMEFQQRGVLHFHVFLSSSLFLGGPWLLPRFIQRVRRHGEPTDLVRGPFEHRCVHSWLDGLPGSSPDAERFNWGGIIELFRTPDAAARYAGKEAGKRAQKELPEGEAGFGRWWWASPECKPPVTGLINCPDEGLPPWRLVFDQEQIRVPAAYLPGLPRTGQNQSPSDLEPLETQPET